MIEIAILGYGTVGAGVFDLFEENGSIINKKAGRDITVKKILDIRKFPGDPAEKYITNNIDEILSDESIKIIVEVIGGINPAYEYVKKALILGKSVVTSNKELVAAYGAELLRIAKDNNTNFLFEASVGGVIPIIRPINQSITSDEITGIKGILNGTTNFILTEMSDSGKTYDEALAEAKRLCYAERDHSADVDGWDACRKLAILLSLAVGQQVDYKDIHTEGITSLTKEDFAFARKTGGTIKLVALSAMTDRGIYARVSPLIVKESSPLYPVSGVYNAIVLKGRFIDEIMFYGKGAGKHPTAAAVASDVVDAAKHLNINITQLWSSDKLKVLPAEGWQGRKLVRLSYINKDGARDRIDSLFGSGEIIEVEGISTELAFITGREIEKTIDDSILKLTDNINIDKIISVIRMDE